LIHGWIDDGDLRQLSPRTLEERRDVLGKLLWFLRHREYADCGAPQLHSFLAYVSRGHEQAGGRWDWDNRPQPEKPAQAKSPTGNAPPEKKPRAHREVKASTAKAYHRVLRGPAPGTSPA
jgi:hypothetical protein